MLYVFRNRRRKISYLPMEKRRYGFNGRDQMPLSTISDANASLHDRNYSVVVSNDFGSEESDLTEVMVKDGILNGLVGWWKFDEGSGTVAYDSSGNGHDGNFNEWTNLDSWKSWRGVKF